MNRNLTIVPSDVTLNHFQSYEPQGKMFLQAHIIMCFHIPCLIPALKILQERKA